MTKHNALCERVHSTNPTYYDPRCPKCTELVLTKLYLSNLKKAARKGRTTAVVSAKVAA